MGIDPVTKERKDISAIKTILVSDPELYKSGNGSSESRFLFLFIRSCTFL